MQSIYTAAQLAQPGTHVFVHDIQRLVEKTYSEKLLGDYDHVQEVNRLRNYYNTP
ncbi:hypothetical protein [Salinibacter ruber]|uniref:hypothetical protein n=1 Tax=Salinibacter ruber TaxID=146919 RepID=UPI003C6E3906